MFMQYTKHIIPIETLSDHLGVPPRVQASPTCNGLTGAGGLECPVLGWGRLGPAGVLHSSHTGKEGIQFD